ncbi:methionine ABC transporter permease [Coxiella burnetii]|uniref:methionine ABC transporter permease n=1 Tax=Coxiella burnetii TaxID=777 RepID=UPI000592857D|nr:methionine ABC transporter permease [Coxiella burnetii]ATN73648.1 methionine ABC transporter permease [Coxiella burnetii]ATN75556.1 methionine ABC transporter permease [Coxiella burnetii]ATN77470.1 methionine ABC transporter permease [Coxiella burnetii]ATN79386.1 methionine ABC transporter permease [Coxiella burnetii]OYK92600.1 ABC transporter permease [Coxiella burnetii]
MSVQMIGAIVSSLGETIEMVIIPCIIAVLIGLPLGVILLVTQKNQLLARPFLNRVLSSLVNATRSIPFIILMIAIIPLTRFIVGTSIGTTAAIVPLSLCAIPFFARLSETAMQEVPAGLVEATQAMGATPMQIIRKVLIPEALPTLVRGITLTAVTLVGYSAMAGVVGGGGLGDLAIRYGYERFDIRVMLITIAVLIVLVQLLQYLGDWAANRLSYYK